MRLIVVVSFLFLSAGFASKSDPGPLPSETGNKYILPKQIILGENGPQTIDIRVIPLEEYRMIVENRSFKDDVLEFADREEIERSNDEN